VGASPLFPPEQQTPQSAQEGLADLIHTDPQTLGETRSRWTLASLQRHCVWLQPLTVGGVCHVLHRLHITHKLARAYVHSPDPDYRQKIADVQAILRRSLPTARASVVLFVDQMGYYRQPHVGQAWEVEGHRQPLARRGYRSDRSHRVVGALNPFSGQVLYRQAAHIDVSTLVGFYQMIAATYGDVQTIYLVMDNWPIHFHPDVLAALEPQQFPWPMHRPHNWPTEPSKNARRLNLPIQMVLLPTYAPWTNPIEKLWRWVRQAYAHAHPYSDDFNEYKANLTACFAQAAAIPADIRRYCGLSNFDLFM